MAARGLPWHGSISPRCRTSTVEGVGEILVG